MFNAGYTKRTNRRVNVLRGFDGCNPNTFTRTAPVKSGETIKSGALITLDSVSGEWVAYDVSSHAEQVPYIALSDDTDTDVAASGLLPALSCAGKFEIETPLFDDDTYAEDTPITGGTGGTAGLIAVGALDGTVPLIGVASRGGRVDLNAGGGPKVEVNADNSEVVTFVTNWQPINQTA
jgi:hypothetical protein